MSKSTFIVMSALILGACGDRETPERDVSTAMEDLDAAMQYARSDVQAELEYAAANIETWIAELEGSAQDLQDCVTVPDLEEVAWQEGVEQQGWGYAISFAGCTLTGEVTVDGTAIISFENLMNLEQNATDRQVSIALGRDLSQLAEGDIDVYSEVHLYDSLGGDAFLSGESHIDSGETKNRYSATIVSSRGDTIEASWRGTTTLSEDVLTKDSQGQAGVGLASGPWGEWSTTTEGLMRRTNETYPHAGTITLSGDRSSSDARGVTISFTETSPTTGEAQITGIDGETETHFLPLL